MRHQDCKNVSLGVSLFGGAAIPFDRLRLILGNSLAIVI